MTIHPLAGKPAPRDRIANIPRLVSAYYTRKPDPADPRQQVSFGTSGHRGSAIHSAFNEDHILATTQAICELRQRRGTTGPLFLGQDTHALSEPALTSALEVLAAWDVPVRMQHDRRYTPTPVVSHAILTHNRGRERGLADGIVITPSHNPPEDGGFKYNPPEGGPADAATTRRIQERANQLLVAGTKEIRRVPITRAMQSGAVVQIDFVGPYVADLENVIDMAAVAGAGLKIGVDPMGGSSIDLWDPIADRYGIAIDVVNRSVDPTFAFMPLDKDGKIRMDCSSPYAMAGLVGLKERFDIAFGNDTDADRHGIVTKSAGLMNPNHYLAVCVDYLFRHRPGWDPGCAVGKTLVSSSLIDRVAAALSRPLVEVPVGFKWFVSGLLDGTFGFGGEESAGASFLRKDGTVWTTDKDGIILDLLACEMTARTGKDPSQHYEALTAKLGAPVYRRIDAPANSSQKRVLAELSTGGIGADTLAGDDITAMHTRAPGNDAPIGGLKVVTANGWFAARPSGTEEIYKIYAESFVDEAHLDRILEEAQAIVDATFRTAGV
jgi:phosphoglucomutase